VKTNVVKKYIQKKLASASGSASDHHMAEGEIITLRLAAGTEVVADVERQELRGISLMAVGEALGHRILIDQRTLETAFQASEGKPVKAFINHDWNHSPTEIAGMFSGLYIDTQMGKLRAERFRFLKAFVDHNKAAYDVMMELATEHPESIGVSLHARGVARWVMADGSEEDAVPDRDGDWKPPQEAAINALPSLRITSLVSADFVDQPAANKDGLYSRPAAMDTNPTPAKESHMSLNKALHAEFAEQPALLARAIALSLEMDDAEKIIETVRAEAKEQRLAALEQHNKEMEARLQAEQAARAEAEKKLSEINARLSRLSITAKPVNTEPAPTTETVDRGALMRQYARLQTQEERIDFCKANPGFLLSGCKRE
jgi:hypothetical protein